MHALTTVASPALQTRLSRFLMRIEDSYLDNPYHNRVHATDVLQWTHMLMKRGGVLHSLQVGRRAWPTICLSVLMEQVLLLVCLLA